MVGSQVTEFEYYGRYEQKKFKLKWVKNANNLKELRLCNNEIKTIKKIRHLKKLEVLNLGGNQIKEIQAGCFNGLKLTRLYLFNN